MPSTPALDTIRAERARLSLILQELENNEKTNSSTDLGTVITNVTALKALVDAADNVSTL